MSDLNCSNVKLNQRYKCKATIATHHLNNESEALRDRVGGEYIMLQPDSIYEVIACQYGVVTLKGDKLEFFIDLKTFMTDFDESVD